MKLNNSRVLFWLDLEVNFLAVEKLTELILLLLETKMYMTHNI
jgi:hypothetical protein